MFKLALGYRCMFSAIHPLSFKPVTESSVVAGDASEREVNEGISHETLTGGPIMRVATADEDEEETRGEKKNKASPLMKWVTT